MKILEEIKHQVEQQMKIISGKCIEKRYAKLTDKLKQEFILKVVQEGKTIKQVQYFVKFSLLPNSQSTIPLQRQLCPSIGRNKLITMILRILAPPAKKIAGCKCLVPSPMTGGSLKYRLCAIKQTSVNTPSKTMPSTNETSCNQIL